MTSLSTLSRTTDPKIIWLKALDPGRRPCYGGSRRTTWPKVGQWTPTRKVQVCRSGWHLFDANRIIAYLAPELYRVVYKGEQRGHPDRDKIAVQQAKLTRRLVWNEKVALAWTADVLRYYLRHPDQADGTLRQNAEHVKKLVQLLRLWSYGRSWKWVKPRLEEVTEEVKRSYELVELIEVFTDLHDGNFFTKNGLTRLAYRLTAIRRGYPWGDERHIQAVKQTIADLLLVRLGVKTKRTPAA